uniref:Uncharacterized protein n=3 Tax=unclassified Microvirus TaxID=338099 RepID=A0AAU8B632_9VIRU
MTGMTDDTQAILRAFRRTLKKYGFSRCTVRQSDNGYYVVTAYDDLSDSVFCRSYTPEEMQCIYHSDGIFWRFLK